MTSSDLESRNIAISMRKSVENLVISSQDAIGQHISQALTFSGVITQQQIIPENRSVSRSPSPSPSASLRNDGLDLENDKISEHSVGSAWHGAGDSASVSSGEGAAIGTSAATANNTNAAKFQGGVSSVNCKVSDTGGGRTKKKSWYNSLYPTYKSKAEDFKRLFKDLPDDERLIVDYSCALQKDILVHGRLYASQNYLCFFASIFGWETSLVLRWKDVTAITKEKTALVIPNAILVCTEGEKNFLTSFSGRDKAYLMLFRIWQNALMDQPMSSTEFWQWVHSSYGEELGFNSDEEGYSRELPDEVAIVLPDVAEVCNNRAEESLDSSMDASGGEQTRDEQRNTRAASRGRDSSPPLLTNGDAEYREDEAADALPTDMSDTSDSEPEKPHNGGGGEKCTESHEGKLLLRQEFPFNIDQLFTMIFTNSQFNLELLAARRTTDYVQSPWQVQAGMKCRQISYTLGLTSGPIGPKEVQVTEMQIMNKCSKPGVMYSIDSTCENAGIPYADYFSVQAHYCLQRLNDNLTDVAFYGFVKYKKTMWPMIKTFLEKNTMAGLEEFARILQTRLISEAEHAVPAARKARRLLRGAASSQEATAAAASAGPLRAAAGGSCGPRGPRLPPARPAACSLPLLAALAVLLLFNAALYLRLYYADRHDYSATVDLHDRMSSVSGSQMADWSKLLEQHSQRQRGQLIAWKDALDRTVAHLTQTEQALSKLLETIKPSLEKAQRDAETRDEL